MTRVVRRTGDLMGCVMTVELKEIGDERSRVGRRKGKNETEISLKFEKADGGFKEVLYLPKMEGSYKRWHESRPGRGGFRTVVGTRTRQNRVKYRGLS